MKARAFCPGHITGFFIIEDSDPDFRKKGSRGAGFCTVLGAISKVELGEGQGIKIFINGKEEDAPITRTGLSRILGDRKHQITADITLQLPQSSGFGMSAAGTFASCLALTHLLEIEDPKNTALEATHFTEIQHKTGLGDAVAQSVGGFVLRKEAGLPPFGIVEQLDFEGEITLCVLDDSLKTSQILSDKEARQRIIGVGCEAMGVFENTTDLATFVQQSWKFAQKTELISTKIQEIIGTACQQNASMAMLGNSIFAFGSFDCAEGHIFKTKIEKGGAKLLD